MNYQDLRNLQESYFGIYEARDGYGDDSKFNKPDDKIKKPGTEVPAPKKGGYGRISRSIPYGIGAHANRTASRVTTITGGDPGAPRSEKMAKDEKKPKTRKLTRGKDGKWSVGEDFELWVESLLDEGYDLSDYTWDDMYDFYLDEAAVNWDTGKTKSGTSPRKKTENKFVQYGFSTNPRDQKRAEQLALVHQNMTDAIKKTGKRRVGKAGPIASARFRNAAIRQRGGKQPSLPIKTVPGLRDANSEVKKEQVDLYDLVLSHLIDEGYAYNEEAATAIMANMSEEWVNSIVEHIQ